MCFASQPPALFGHLNFQKVVRTPRALYILTWKCASRHNGVHLLDISTSKSGSEADVFLYILTWKCASRHNGVHLLDISTSKSGSEADVFLYILTWKCASRHNGVHLLDISTSKSGSEADVFLYILTWKCASLHNGVHFFDISTSKSGPKLTCFVHFDLEMCFAPQRRALFHLSSGQLALHPPLYRGYFSTLQSPKSLEKHSESRLSYLFTHLHLLSSDFLHLLSFHFLTSPR